MSSQFNMNNNMNNNNNNNICSSFDLNNSSLTSVGNFYQEDRTLMNVLISLFYPPIIILSLCGNLLVSKTIILKPNMINQTNILILVLSFSDLLTTIFNIPFTVMDIILNDWIFGEFMCVFVSFIQANCVYVSSFTMALIAIHRHRCVYNTNSRTRSGRSTLKKWFILTCSIMVVLILATIASLPHTIYVRILVSNVTDYGMIRLCRPVLPETSFNLSFWITLETLLTQYMIPMSLVMIIYTRIGFTIYHQGHVGQFSEERNKEITAKKSRRIIMLGLVVAIFALCWLPFNIYYLLVEFNVINLDFRIFLFCHWFAMSSVCYNPFVYCWLNESFRREAKLIAKLLNCSQSSGDLSSHSSDENIQQEKSFDLIQINSRRHNSFEITFGTHQTNL